MKLNKKTSFNPKSTIIILIILTLIGTSNIVNAENNYRTHHEISTLTNPTPIQRAFSGAGLVTSHRAGAGKLYSNSK